jgi:hypothetical protein
VRERTNSWGSSMDRHHKILLIINLVGGLAVLGSYARGLFWSELGNAFWGNVPEGLKPIYTVAMLAATLGYFAFSVYLFRLNPSKVVFFGRFSFGVVNKFLVAILAASALWMPLTSIFIQEPSTPLWWAIRLVLLVTGAASIALLAAIVTSTDDWNVLRTLAVAGAIAFCFQTAILDALVWPYFFR